MKGLWLAALAAVLGTSACTVQKAADQTRNDSATGATASASIASGDSSFAAMQHRGEMAMGVDQYKSTHKFDTFDDGGRIELQSDSGDSLEVAQIRSHLKLIQHAFAAGDFSAPAFVHMKDMPGTAAMAQKKSVIAYTYADLPRGGEVRIKTSDPEAKAAIAQFLDAQRSEHHATGSGAMKH